MTEDTKFMERRVYTRHLARTKVQVRAPGKDPKMCMAVNLSTAGVAIKTQDMNLSKDALVELTFTVNLGTIVKLHKRQGRVVYVKNGVTGFAMLPHGTKAPVVVKP